ncbi:NF-kappaB-p65 acetylation inhibitor [Orf virus]|nr:NF-kappaB-p65 acetylation inhibitor [Orf virus]
MTPTSRESLLTTLLVEYLVRARRPSPALVRALLAAGARAAGPDAAGRLPLAALLRAALRRGGPLDTRLPLLLARRGAAASARARARGGVWRSAAGLLLAAGPRWRRLAAALAAAGRAAG